MKNKLKIISLIALLPFTASLVAGASRTYPIEDMPVSQIARYEQPYRLISSADANGRTVELDDGAIWSIQGSDSQSKVRSWRSNDSVVIHPALFPMWSGSQFYLFNERTRSCAYAHLSANPYAGTPTQIVIDYIDYVRGEVHIIDGTGRQTYCRVNPKYLSEFSRWNYGNTVLLGSNQDCYSGWFSEYPYILINVERQNHGFVEIIFE